MNLSSFRILLPFFRTSWGVCILNSAVFNSFHNWVEFGTILEGLRNFGGELNPPLGTPLATVFEVLHVVADYSETSVTIYQSQQNITCLPNLRSLYYYFLRHCRRHLILLYADGIVAACVLWHPQIQQHILILTTWKTALWSSHPPTQQILRLVVKWLELWPLTYSQHWGLECMVLYVYPPVLFYSMFLNHGEATVFLYYIAWD